MFSTNAVARNERIPVQRAYLRLADTGNIGYSAARTGANVVSHKISIPERSLLSNLLHTLACLAPLFPYGYLLREILA